MPRLLKAATVLFLAAITLIRLISLPETDIFFAIYHGQNILRGVPIVAADSWNFQSAGEAWTSNSWLWDVVLALAYNALGLIGVSLLNGACFAASLLLAWKICARQGLQGWRRIALVATFTLASFFFFTGRAVDSDILLLLTFTWVAAVLHGKLSGWRHVAAVFIASLITSSLSMNLHLAAIAFVPLLPAITLLLIASASWSRRATLLTASLLGSAIGVIFTPYGIAGVTKAQAVVDASRRFIVEWNSPDLATPLGWIVLIVLLLALGLIARLIWDGRYLSAVLLLALNVAAFEAIRFTIYVIVISLMVEAQALAGWKVREFVPFTRANQRLILGFAGVITMICASTVAFTYAYPERLTGVAAGDFASFSPGSRVISSPSEGSAILFYRRDLQVAVDGRNDLLGAKRYAEATNVFGYASVPELRAWLNQHRVDGAFFTAQQNAALGSRFKELGWKAHAGHYGVAYTRTR